MLVIHWGKKNMVCFPPTPSPSLATETLAQFDLGLKIKVGNTIHTHTPNTHTGPCTVSEKTGDVWEGYCEK